MEDLLLNIVKEATGTKLASLKQSAQEAHGKSPFVTIPRSITRHITDSRSALQPKQPTPQPQSRTANRLLRPSEAVPGKQEEQAGVARPHRLQRKSPHYLRCNKYTKTQLQKIVRDERFQSGTEPEDDSLWLPAQLLLATSSMLSQCEDTQVHVLRVVLNLACSASWALNGRLVMLLIGRCGEAYENGTQPVRAAAQAAASQTLTAFCTFLGIYIFFYLIIRKE
jgi:hypothetical protein